MIVRFLNANKALVAGVALAVLASMPSAAQTISLTPGDATGTFSAGQAWAGLTTNAVQNPDTISYFYSGSWVEWPITVTTPGMYSVLVNTGTPLNNIKAQVHIIPLDGLGNYAAPVAEVPRTGELGTYDYDIRGSFTIPNVPLWQVGLHVLRLRNASILLSTNANREPSNENDTSNATRFTGFNVGNIELNRTGDLPPMGTITGKVTSPDLGGVGIGAAYVMASTEPTPEPGPMWQRGFWATTNDLGEYTLPAFAGEQAVQVGSPAMMSYAGTTAAVAVPGGGTATKDLQLASRGTKLPDGKFTVQVECEMFIDKNPDEFSTSAGTYHPSPVVLQGRPICSNGFMAGYVDIGNYVDVPVYIPSGQGGEYIVSALYFNGFWNAVDYPDAYTKFTANLGSAEESTTGVLEPNTAGFNPDTGDRYGPADGYNRSATVTAATPLVLKEGYNLIRVEATADESATTAAAWDAFTLTQKDAPVVPPGAKQALKIAAGLEGAPSGGTATYTALNVVTTGSSATAIDLLDAVRLAKDGKL